jgi:hypothetical protein
MNGCRIMGGDEEEAKDRCRSRSWYPALVIVDLEIQAPALHVL